MNTCKTCKYWHPFYDTPQYGACLLMPLRELDDKSIFPATKALSQITGRDLVFNTGQNFGCVLHEIIVTLQ